LNNIDEIIDTDKYSLSLSSKKVLNTIAVDLKKNTAIANAEGIIDKLEHIALVSNADIVNYAISLYDDITLLYELFPDIEEHYDYKEKMQVVLDEYNLTGSLVEDLNDSAIASFTFAESINNPDAWIATLLPVVTSSLVPQIYKYEIKMTHKTEGTVETYSMVLSL